MSEQNIGVVYYPGPELSARGKFNRQALDPLVERINAEKVTIDAYWPLPEFNLGNIPASAYMDSWATKIQYRRALRRAARQFDVLFIASQDFLWIDPSKTNSTIIPYVHDVFPVTTMFSNKIESHRAREYTSNMLNCSKIVSASKKTKQDIYHRTPYGGEVRVVYQGVEQPNVEISDIEIDLLYVGSLIERKDPTFLQKSIKLAKDCGFNCVAVNFEDINLPCQVLSGLSEAELAEKYASSRYYLHPSRAEGFGRAPVEAQLHGTIPLGRDISINHEILGEPGKSWYPVSTPEEVRGFLNKKVTAEQRMAAVENTRRFSWNHTIEKLATILIDTDQ